jgi:hypothetical protein
MRRTKHGWKPADLEAAYRAAGFVPKATTKHDGYYHPSYPILMTTVTRSDPVKADCIDDLLDLVDRLHELQAGD